MAYAILELLQQLVSQICDNGTITLGKVVLQIYKTKTYIVGTQKNRLEETVLLSTQNICLN